MIQALAFLAITAVAPQPGPAGDLDMVVIEAINACPKGAAGEIAVCGRRPGSMPYQPYRVPEAFRTRGFDPTASTESASRERNRIMEGGAAGTGSCSAVGGGGTTGCTVQQWQRGEQQRAGY
ncbi:MAG: hypothetical protein JWM75_123 [Sphingomonas bacterium]|nr:hypothetical protein [Sphingomonas bacterium]